MEDAEGWVRLYARMIAIVKVLLARRQDALVFVNLDGVIVAEIRLQIAELLQIRALTAIAVRLDVRREWLTATMMEAVNAM
jgi:hypothetical protein